MTLQSFKGLHYNGIKLLDFSVGSSLFQELFLNYFQMFTVDYSLLIMQQSVTINLNDLEKDLNNLLSFIYIKNSINDKVCDVLVENNNLLQPVLYENMNLLEKKYKKSCPNLNIPVCILLKYIENRNEVASAAYNFPNKSEYYQINISDFIKKKTDFQVLLSLLNNFYILNEKLNKILYLKNNQIICSELKKMKSLIPIECQNFIQADFDEICVGIYGKFSFVNLVVELSNETVSFNVDNYIDFLRKGNSIVLSQFPEFLKKIQLLSNKSN